MCDIHFILVVFLLNINHCISDAEKRDTPPPQYSVPSIDKIYSRTLISIDPCTRPHWPSVFSWIGSFFSLLPNGMVVCVYVPSFLSPFTTGGPRDTTIKEPSLVKTSFHFVSSILRLSIAYCICLIKESQDVLVVTVFCLCSFFRVFVGFNSVCDDSSVRSFSFDHICSWNRIFLDKKPMRELLMSIGIGKNTTVTSIPKCRW